MPRVIHEIPVQEKQVVCTGCGRTIAYVKNDVKEDSGENYGGFWQQEYIHCPGDGCGKQIVLKSW